MSQPTCVQSRHTVLVVDDEAPLAAVLRDILEGEGLDVLVAGDGATALRIAAETVPCLALVDIMMPVMDGLTLCRRLREDPRTETMPIVLVSALARPEDVTQGLAAGADDYIRKPFDTGTVRFRTRAHLRHHEAKLEVQRLRERLSMISRAAQDAIIVLDGEGAVAHWNEAAETMFGYAQAEALGRPLHEMIVPQRFRAAHHAGLTHFAATGRGELIGRTVELDALRKSGEELPVELSLSATPVDGRWWAVGIVRDITARKRAEERFRILFFQSRDALMTAEPPDWRFTSGNPAAIALFGADDEADFCSRALWEYSPPTQPDGRPSLDCARERIGEALQAGQASFAWTHRRLDGTDFAAHVLLTRIEFGGHPCIQATVRDVTAEQRLQLELGQARKLQAVGQLASGIAHEINTPVQFISDSVHFLRETCDAVDRLLPLYRDAAARLDPGDPLSVAIRAVDAEVDLGYLLDNAAPSFGRCIEGLARVASIVRAMREFAHPEQRQKSRADLNEALENTLVIARSEYKYVAEVETDFGDIPLVACHVGDLNQVFLNLLVNAAHAIADVVGESGDKGTIGVRTHLDGDQVVVEISDTGPGIPEAHRERIFEPFFTTKPVGKGSGQGLAIARAVIVERHGGTLNFETTGGRGTTFTIRLPIGRDADPDIREVVL
ncbi:MAG: PAS domain S-box protein [Armatimonadetes bacterium]|nr:PAS domain S-box protein [Armatimonadota bacterium]